MAERQTGNCTALLNALKHTHMKKTLFATALISVILLQACSRSFEPINYGSDACAHCRMTIMDERYGAELVDQKGKVFKFDDIVCLKQFVSAQQPSGESLLFVEDYLQTNQGMLDARTAVYLHHPFFRSPMNGSIAAFASDSEAKALADSLQAQSTTWEQIQ